MRKMEIKMTPIEKTDLSWICALSIDGKPFCYTLEDVPLFTNGRPKKVLHKTGIPRGRYEVVVSWSNRFGMYMPLLLNVPQFTGIRMHKGNDILDTDGCILVAKANPSKQNIILDSKAAFDAIVPIITNAAQSKKVFITLLG